MRSRPLERGWVRGILLAVGVLAVGAGAYGALRGTPRITLSNTGLRIDQPTAAPLYALLAAAGALTLFVALPSRGRSLRGLALIVAAGFAGLSATRAAFRVEVGRERLSIRGLAGSRSVPWTEITRVDTNPTEVRLEGRSGPPLRLAIGSLSPEQRASLERAIARHVAEAQSPATPR